MTADQIDAAGEIFFDEIGALFPGGHQSTRRSDAGAGTHFIILPAQRDRDRPAIALSVLDNWTEQEFREKIAEAKADVLVADARWL